MNKTPKPTYCWDSCIWLAYLNDEPGARDVDLLVKRVQQKEVVLIVPVLTISELLTAKHSEEQVNYFWKFTERSGVVLADTTVPIAKLAEQVRSRCLNAQPSRSIKLPDATVIATAILHKVDALHTFDGKVLALDSTPLVDGLRITKPRDPSGQMPLIGLGP